jgi:hypothetical protein
MDDVTATSPPSRTAYRTRSFMMAYCSGVIFAAEAPASSSLRSG